MQIFLASPYSSFHVTHPHLCCRESKYCAIKHHWWWKTAFVFDRLRMLHAYTGPVLFLEEDHAATPDLLHVLHRAATLMTTQCPQCAFLTLGARHAAGCMQLYGEKNDGVMITSPWTLLLLSLIVLFVHLSPRILASFDSPPFTHILSLVQARTRKVGKAAVCASRRGTACATTWAWLSTCTCCDTRLVCMVTSVNGSSHRVCFQRHLGALALLCLPFLRL